MPRSPFHRAWCAVGSASPGRGDCTPSLADVLLHHVGRPLMRLRRVVAELAQRAALAQEIPVLVELYLQRGEAMRLPRRKLAPLEEPGLFTHHRLPIPPYPSTIPRLGHRTPPPALSHL